MVPSNVRKNKGTTKCGKSTVIYDVSTAYCKDGTIECEKKKRELFYVTKVQSHVILVLHNVKIVLSNVRKNK